MTYSWATASWEASGSLGTWGTLLKKDNKKLTLKGKCYTYFQLSSFYITFDHSHNTQYCAIAFLVGSICLKIVSFAY